MDRFCALLLTLVFSLPLFTPFLQADSDAKLPACCRKDGKHGCAMMKKKANPASGSTIQAIKIKCSEYPQGRSFPMTGTLQLSPPAPIAIALSQSGVVAAQMEALYRVSHARSSQKRGPPFPAL